MKNPKKYMVKSTMHVLSLHCKRVSCTGAVLTLNASHTPFFIFITQTSNALDRDALTCSCQTVFHLETVKKCLQDVEAWLASRDLPRKLRHETVAFFCDAWIGQAGRRDLHQQDNRKRL